VGAEISGSRDRLNGVPQHKVVTATVIRRPPVTPRAGNATHTATIEGVPFFVNGTAPNQNQTFTFTLYSNAVTTAPSFSFNGSLLRVFTASLSFTFMANPPNPPAKLRMAACQVHSA
jgi:hypothetical protein